MTKGGLQEITYSGSGSETSQLDSYSIAGHLLGETNGTTTTYDLTDAQDTILLSLTASAIQGEQAYDPYGNLRYSSGTIGTDKGYTGQFDDAVTGLDYYNARGYDPVSGQFLSPDTVQGNAQGMDPYAYVGNNPETRVDPTGQYFTDGNGNIAWRADGATQNQLCGNVANCSVSGFTIENASQGTEDSSFNISIDGVP